MLTRLFGLVACVLAASGQGQRWNAALSARQDAVPKRRLYINVTFEGPPGVPVRYPGVFAGSRKWSMLFYEGGHTPSFCVSGGYARVATEKVPVGQYHVQVVDRQVPDLVLTRLERVVIDGNSNALDVVVPMSSVTIDARFAGFAYGDSPTSQARLRNLAVQLLPEPLDGEDGYDVPSGGGGFCLEPISREGIWDEAYISTSVDFSAPPGRNYTALFYSTDDPDGEPLHTTSFRSPSDGSAGSSLLMQVTLPQTLLCPDHPTVITQATGSVPASNAPQQWVYVPGSSCVWDFPTERQVLFLAVNCTAMALGYMEIIYGPESTKRMRFSASRCGPSLIDQLKSVTFTFTGDAKNYTGRGVLFEWERVPETIRTQPDFMLMIVVVSTVASAIILFTWFWYCIFRPAQLRRQQAATGAAASTRTASVRPRTPDKRDCVPVRYLRLLEVTTYTAKVAAETATDAPAAANLSQPAGYGKCIAMTAATATAPDGSAGADDAGAVAGGDGGGRPGLGDHLDGAAGVEPITSTAGHGCGVDGATQTSAVTSSPEDGGCVFMMMIVSSPLAATASSSGKLTPDRQLDVQREPGLSGREACSICLCEFEEGDPLKHLPCKHFYHVPCIDTWLSRDITCPLCKDNVLEAMRMLLGPLPRRRAKRQGNTQANASGTDSTAAAIATASPTTAGDPVCPISLGVEMVVIVDDGSQASAGDGRSGAMATASSGAATGTASHAAGLCTAAGPIGSNFLDPSLGDHDAAMTPRRLAAAMHEGPTPPAAGGATTGSPRSEGLPTVGAASESASDAAITAAAGGASQTLLAIRSNPA